jgi:hypothetical protein
MKNKVAVMIGGELRTFNSCYKSWEFLDNNIYDIFFSTWGDNEKKILERFPNAYIESKKDNFLSTNLHKMDYHWKTLFKMADSTNFQYEYVVITRPDIYLQDSKSIYDFLINYCDDYLYTFSKITHSLPPFPPIFVQDIFFAGKYNFLKNIFNSLIIPDNVVYDMHYYLSKHLVMNDIYVEDIRNNLNFLNWEIKK